MLFSGYLFAFVGAGGAPTKKYFHEILRKVAADFIGGSRHLGRTGLVAGDVDVTESAVVGESGGEASREQDGGGGKRRPERGLAEKHARLVAIGRAQGGAVFGQQGDADGLVADRQDARDVVSPHDAARQAAQRRRLMARDDEGIVDAGEERAGGIPELPAKGGGEEMRRERLAEKHVEIHMDGRLATGEQEAEGMELGQVADMLDLLGDERQWEHFVEREPQAIHEQGRAGASATSTVRIPARRA